MFVKEIKYERLARLGGAFENGRISITVALDRDDDDARGMELAKTIVHTQLRLLGATLINDPEERTVPPIEVRGL